MPTRQNQAARVGPIAATSPSAKPYRTGPPPVDKHAATCSSSTAAVAGLDLILVPEWLVGSEIRKGGLREVLPEFQIVPQASPLYAVYPHQRHLPPKVRAFIDFLVERFAAQPGWDGGQ